MADLLSVPTLRADLDGQVLRTDAVTHPDLFWAIRGGGGNFGVATRFKFRLHELDTVVGGMLILPATPEVVESVVAQGQAAPEELSTVVNVMTPPPMPFLPPELHGKLVVMALICYSGKVGDGERVEHAGRSLAPPWAGSCAGMSVVSRTLERTETIERVDAPAGAVQRFLRRLLPDRPGIVAPLGGSWVGHPLHPILVLTPIGTWLSASLLDAVPGQQVAARRLVLTGLLAAVPAALTGAVDFRTLEGRQRRTGFLHLLSNLTATACYAASYQSRRRGHAGAGQVLGLLGLAAVGTGGTLGGHLTYAQGVGVYRWQPDRAAQLQPAEPAAEPRSPVGRSTWP